MAVFIGAIKKKGAKKIESGLYFYKGYYISIVRLSNGDSYWNIWEDENLTEEFWIGFHTKWQAMEYVDKFGERD